MNLQLNDRVVLLVGGAGTLGAACAELFAREGARVVVADQSKPEFADIDHFVEVDVVSEFSVREAVQHVATRCSSLHVLVNLAGIYQGGSIANITADDWRRVIDVNLTGTFLACREVLPTMQRQDYGRIICVASLAGQVGGVVAGANYAASKAGVLSLVKSLAKQCEKPWITINAVNPGPVDGTMTAAWPTEQREMVREKIPLKRFAQPNEVAAVIAFLASPLAACIHGAHIDINGGLYMG